MRNLYSSLRSVLAIAALSLGASALAQSVTPGYYYLKTTEIANNPGTHMRATSQDNVQMSAAELPATPTVAEKPFIWQVEAKGEGLITLRNIWNNRYLGGQNAAWSHHCTTDDIAHTLKISDPSANGSFRLDITDMTLSNQYGTSVRPGGGSEQVFLWICDSQNGDISSWTFEPVDADVAAALETTYPTYTGVDVEEGIYYIKADAANTSKPGYYLYANMNDKTRTYQAENAGLSATELTEEMLPYMFKVSKGQLGYAFQNLFSSRYVGGTPNNNGHHVGATVAPAYMKVEAAGEGIYRILDEYQPANGFLPAYLNSGNEGFAWWAGSAEWLTSSIGWNLIRVTAPATLEGNTLSVTGFVSKDLIADAVARQQGADIKAIVLNGATLGADITAQNIRGGLDESVMVYVAENAVIEGENIVHGNKPTAISSTEANAEATAIYSLDGKRLSAPAKGISIIRTAGSARKVLK